MLHNTCHYSDHHHNSDGDGDDGDDDDVDSYCFFTRIIPMIIIINA
jgi:hypothetical protein